MWKAKVTKIVWSHVGRRGEQNIHYKGMETSP